MAELFLYKVTFQTPGQPEKTLYRTAEDESMALADATQTEEFKGQYQVEQVEPMTGKPVPPPQAVAPDIEQPSEGYGASSPTDEYGTSPAANVSGKAARQEQASTPKESLKEKSSKK